MSGVESNVTINNGSNDGLLIVDGRVRAAISQDVPLILFRVVCSIIGVPLNVLIATAVLRLRRLNSKPRNIFLLGITFSNLTAFVPVLFEVIYFFYPSDIVCRCYVAVIGMPDIFLLLSIFLSLAHCYVAIRFPLWHRKKVTVCRAVLCIVTSFILAILINKFVYIVGMEPFECAVNFRAGRVIGTSLAVLFFLCIFVRVTVHQQTKQLLIDNRLVALTETGVTNGHQQEDIRLDNLDNAEEENGNDEVVDRQTRNNQESHLHVSMNQQALHRMELEATKTLVAGVTSLFVFSSPAIVFIVSMNVCRLV